MSFLYVSCIGIISDNEPQRLKLLSKTEPTDPVTVHLHNNRIVVISERKELRPAKLKFAWEIQDIVDQRIDDCHLILKNDQSKYTVERITLLTSALIK